VIEHPNIDQGQGVLQAGCDQKADTDPQAGALRRLHEAVERLQGLGIADTLGAQRHRILGWNLAIEQIQILGLELLSAASDADRYSVSAHHSG